MRCFYYVKQELFGVPRGRVEEFYEHRAAALVRDGSIEQFDPKNKEHAAALAKQDRSAQEHREAEDKRLADEFKARGLQH